MITAIILIVLIILGIYLLIKEYEIGFVMTGVMLVVISLVLLLIHIPSVALKSYDYEVMKTKRDSFERTLKNARENGNEYETAAIVKEIANWNQSLAVYKYQNKTLFLDQYIDDRIDELEFIE